MFNEMVLFCRVANYVLRHKRVLELGFDDINSFEWTKEGDLGLSENQCIVQSVSGKTIEFRQKLLLLKDILSASFLDLA